VSFAKSCEQGHPDEPCRHHSGECAEERHEGSRWTLPPPLAMGQYDAVSRASQGDGVRAVNPTPSLSAATFVSDLSEPISRKEFDVRYEIAIEYLVVAVDPRKKRGGAWNASLPVPHCSSRLSLA
jgi:hypothetical protein